MSAAVRTRTPSVDAICAEAVDLALRAAGDLAPADKIGEHVGVEADGDRVVTHYFVCLDPAYRGWQWAVTVTRAARARQPTVDETVLLPGRDAVLPPEWVPWSERLRPGDLGIGDLLPTRENDERLAPGYTAADEEPPGPEESPSPVSFEPGLGRPRVLSFEGREQAAARWYAGPHGPRAPIAEAAPAHCATCGFLLMLDGPLRQLFGVCANEFSPDDGSVVSFDHGCGAHSEVAVMPATPEITEPIVDEFSYEPVVLHPRHSPGSIEMAAAEDLGHS